MSLDRFYSQPGFFLRRLHQISIALFYEEAGSMGITPTQFVTLYIVREFPGTDQGTLCQLAALDKATVVKVVDRLKSRGLITKDKSTEDRRASVLRITPKGSEVIDEMEPMLNRSAARMTAPLTVREHAILMKLLLKLAEHNNALSRAPLNRDAADKPWREPPSTEQEFDA